MADTTQIAVRIELAQLARIDAVAEDLSRATPGLTFTRSDAVKVLLAMGLEAREQRDAVAPEARP